ncbi:branched-chain amino acid ABC transporter permease [Ornithinimicrobium flavum]|uniref:branched-chain amino acid ABC transporter permease n=1 Tax=Ornithinimicrobium flavum TaxID=1288636 RepID=UPI00107015CB|nr:branched-chain amino acid ABC transporter permease [Ornithinimicrobium flavum]
MTSATGTGEDRAQARGTARLTGRSRTLRSGTRRGRVPRSARRGRPRLYTSYDADSALLNTPAKRWWTLAVVLLALVAPFLLSRDLTHLLSVAAVMAIAGIGLNLLTGYAGQISLGHPFFMALGAYTGAVVAGAPGSIVLGWELDLSLALVLAAVVPGAIGLLVAPLATRVRGLYLAVLTLGLLMLGEQVFKQWAALTGGSGVGRAGALPVLFGNDLTRTYAVGPLLLPPHVSLYLVCVVLLAGLGVAARNLARSRSGRAFAAVRDRDIAAEIMGVNLLRTKTLAFALSSAYAGVAGCLYAVLIGRVAPEQWNILMAINLLAIVVIGGVATISGTLLGAAFVVLLPRLLEWLAPWLPFVSTGSGGLITIFQLQSILFGTLIVLFLILEPRGLFGLWHRVRTYFTTWPFSY